MLNVAQELDEMKINDKNQQTWGRIPCLTKLPRRGGGGGRQEASTASAARGLRVLGPKMEPDPGTRSKDQRNLGEEGQTQKETAPQEQAS